MDNLPDQDNRLLAEICKKQKVDITLLQQLIEFEATKVHLQRRRGAKEGIRKLIEGWLEEQNK